MRQRLWKLSIALSAMLFIAIGLLWMRSCFRSDQIRLYTFQSDKRQDWLAFDSGQGRLSLCRNEFVSDLCKEGRCPTLIWEVSAINLESQRRIRTHRDHEVFGFAWYMTDMRNAHNWSLLATRWALTIPYGWALFATMLLPLIAAIQAIRQRFVVGSGYCLKCGYDLRATPDRCPECGTVASRN